MTDSEIRAIALRLLSRVAPETDESALEPDVPLRDQLDIDSMDFLNFIIALDKELKVGVPEADYPKLATLDGIVEYLAAAIARSAGPRTGG